MLSIFRLLSNCESSLAGAADAGSWAKGGAAIIETIFAWGGLGQWAVDRVTHLDLPEMQGIILVLGINTLIFLVILDLLIVFLDPRVSYD